MVKKQKSKPEQIQIRRYKPEDCSALGVLFYQTVHTVNAGDYTEEQLNAWAVGHIDEKAWNRSFLEHITLIAVDGEKITGFADMDSSGYLDRLYVHRDYQRMGIANRLCTLLEEQSGGRVFTTHASITARPFFEKRGYRVIKEQQAERKGVLLTNYVMEKRK